MTTLTYERGAAEGAGSGGGISIDGEVRGLIALAKRMTRDGKTAWDDPVVRDQVMALAVRAEGLRQTARRMRVEALTDHPMRIPLQTKVLMTELVQDIGAAGVEIAGAAGTRYLGDPGAPDGGHWPHSFMNSYGMTIAAGSNEIQRNILGERILGLPKSK